MALYHIISGLKFSTVHVISAGATLLTLLNLFLKFEGSFVVDYLDHLGVEDSDIVYCKLLWLVLIVIRLLVIVGFIYIVLIIWRWVQSRFMINWVRVGIFFTTYFSLIMSLASLVLTLVGGFIHIGIGEVSTPEISSGGSSTESVGIVVDNPVSDLSPGYRRVSDAMYYDYLIKEEPITWSDNPAVVIDIEPVKVTEDVDLQAGPDFTIMPKEVSSASEVYSVPEAPSVPVGRIDSNQLIEELVKWGEKHAPGKEFMGKSRGIPINQLSSMMKKVVGKKSSDQWLKVPSRDVYKKMMADGCRLSSDKKTIARVVRHPRRPG